MLLALPLVLPLALAGLGDQRRTADKGKHCCPDDHAFHGMFPWAQSAPGGTPEGPEWHDLNPR
jgi:hypothetical protein